METRTTNLMKEVAGTIARLITEQGQDIGVSECIVDDFGRYGNFQLVCYLKAKRRVQGYYPNDKYKFNLRKVTALIKRVIKEHTNKGATCRNIESPIGIYSSSYGSKYFEGYERNYTMIDIDFIPYNEKVNLFEGQTKHDGLTQEQSDQLKLSLENED